MRTCGTHTHKKKSFPGHSAWALTTLGKQTQLIRMSITAQREPPRYAPEWRSSPSRQEPDVHRNRRNTQKNRQTNVLTRRPLLGAVLPISIVWCLSQSMCDSISMFTRKKKSTYYMGTYLHTHYKYVISTDILQICIEPRKRTKIVEDRVTRQST